MSNGDASGLTIEGVILITGLQARTGELVIESGNNIGSMYFHQGAILQAFSPYSRAIGDLLVEDGVITEAELLHVLKLQKNEPHRPIGNMLMQTGKVSFEAVEMMVHEQIRQGLNEFTKWEDISISFVDKDIKPYDTINLPVYELLRIDFLKAAFDSLSKMVSITDQSSSTTTSAS